MTYFHTRKGVRAGGSRPSPTGALKHERGLWGGPPAQDFSKLISVHPYRRWLTRCKAVEPGNANMKAASERVWCFMPGQNRRERPVCRSPTWYQAGRGTTYRSFPAMFNMTPGSMPPYGGAVCLRTKNRGKRLSGRFPRFCYLYRNIKSISTLPLMPGTEPVSVYCQMSTLWG